MIVPKIDEEAIQVGISYPCSAFKQFIRHSSASHLQLSSRSLPSLWPHPCLQDDYHGRDGVPWLQSHNPYTDVLPHLFPNFYVWFVGIGQPGHNACTAQILSQSTCSPSPTFQTCHRATMEQLFGSTVNGERLWTSATVMRLSAAASAFFWRLVTIPTSFIIYMTSILHASNSGILLSIGTGPNTALVLSAIQICHLLRSPLTPLTSWNGRAEASDPRWLFGEIFEQLPSYQQVEIISRIMRAVIQAGPKRITSQLYL